MLALRGGGKKVWGDGPFQDAAFLGAVDTLMGRDAAALCRAMSTVFGNWDSAFRSRRFARCSRSTSGW